MSSNVSLATFLPPISILLSSFNKRRQHENDFEPLPLMEQRTDTLTSRLDQLPDVVILHIVSYLDSQDCISASKICRKWYNVCYDPSLWNKMDFSSESKNTKIKLRDKDIICLVLRQPVALIRCIDFSGHSCRFVTNYALFHIARRCHLLHTLNISNCKLLTDTGIKIIVKNCPFIEKLGVSNCKAITNTGVIIALRELPSLESLNVGNNSWITNLPFFYIARYGSRLVQLNIEGCKKVTDAGLHILTRSNTRWKDINLRNTTRITNGGLEEFLAKTPSLEGLKLGFVKKSLVSISILNVIPRCCKNLVLIDFQHYKHVPHIDEYVLEIAKNNPRLRRIILRENISMLSNETLLTLNKLCPDLSQIE